MIIQTGSLQKLKIVDQKNKLSERDNKDWEDFWKNTEQIVDKDTDNLTKKISLTSNLTFMVIL